MLFWRFGNIRCPVILVVRQNLDKCILLRASSRTKWKRDILCCSTRSNHRIPFTESLSAPNEQTIRVLSPELQECMDPNEGSAATGARGRMSRETPKRVRAHRQERTSVPVGCERARRRNQRNLRSNPPSGSSANHGSRRRHPATLHHHPACAQQPRASSRTKRTHRPPHIQPPADILAVMYGTRSRPSTGQ